jgi:hypothetical protein
MKRRQEKRVGTLPKRFNHPDTQIRKSNIPGAGKGLFTTAGFKKGEIIGEYYGPFKKTYDDVPEKYDMYIFTLQNGKILVPSPNCKSQYINDGLAYDAIVLETMEWFIESGTSGRIRKKDIYDIVNGELNEPLMYSDESKGIECDYNVDWLEDGNRVLLKAIRDIDIDEELYVAYGKDYWRELIVEDVCILLSSLKKKKISKEGKDLEV